MVTAAATAPVFKILLLKLNTTSTRRTKSDCELSDRPTSSPGLPLHILAHKPHLGGEQQCKNCLSGIYLTPRRKRTLSNGLQARDFLWIPLKSFATVRRDSREDLPSLCCT